MVETEFFPNSERCLICASPKLRRFKAHASDAEDPALVSVTECQNCSFAWQFPFARTLQESKEHFDANYKAKGSKTSEYFDPKIKTAISALEFNFMSQLPIAGRRLLDIGAGAGLFAALASEHGWSVTALDPALDQEVLVGRPNITAIRGTADDLPINEQFDVVTMWDVIEHVTTPVKAIIDARSRIKDGGWLVIETGNYRSADRVLGGASHWIFQLDHRWYFSPESMSHILARLGFSDFVYSQKTLRPGWVGDTNYSGPSRLGLLKAIAKDPLSASLHISKYRDLSVAKNWMMPGIPIFAIAGRKKVLRDD